MSADSTSQAVVVASASVAKPRLLVNQVPQSILEDPHLNQDISTVLPSNYNFEIHKSIWRIKKANCKRVALQFPEGLLLYAASISDILTKYTAVDTVIMGDVTYGACCVDDLSAKRLGCDFLIHYGHSCLVPVNACVVSTLYVFVTIAFDTSHLLECMKLEFERTTKIALMGTIQFVSCIHDMREALEVHFKDDDHNINTTTPQTQPHARLPPQVPFQSSNIYIPQARPLSPGEVLGCTSPQIDPRSDALVYVADGRFHLESIMISNPNLSAYRYDPYSKEFTREFYDNAVMMSRRKSAIEEVSKPSTVRIGIILGTLGRQGSPKILERVIKTLEKRIQAQQEKTSSDETSPQLSYFVLLISEISPARLRIIEDESRVDAWIQIACPRLSIDWGTAFTRPILTPYEAMVAFGFVEWKLQYPMDYYSKNGGPWTNYHSDSTERKVETVAAIATTTATTAVASQPNVGLSSMTSEDLTKALQW